MITYYVRENLKPSMNFGRKTYKITDDKNLKIG